MNVKPSDLVRFAKKALHGLDESSVFIGVMDDRPLSAARVEFILQVGHCLLEGKPIVLAAERGSTLPPKLVAAADHILWYTKGHPEEIQHALNEYLLRQGVKTQ